MKIHEYQAKELFRKYKVPTPEGGVSNTVQGIEKIAAGLGLPVAVKAQIHAGGRGKGGGVKVARTNEEVTKAAKAILGMTLVTKQTGPEGRIVKTILVEKGVAIKKEMYLSHCSRSQYGDGDNYRQSGWRHGYRRSCSKNS